MLHDDALKFSAHGQLRCRAGRHHNHIQSIYHHYGVKSAFASLVEFRPESF